MSVCECERGSICERERFCRVVRSSGDHLNPKAHITRRVALWYTRYTYTHIYIYICIYALCPLPFQLQPCHDAYPKLACTVIWIVMVVGSRMYGDRKLLSGVCGSLFVWPAASWAYGRFRSQSFSLDVATLLTKFVVAGVMRSPCMSTPSHGTHCSCAGQGTESPNHSCSSTPR